MIQTWSMAFRKEPKYKVVQDTFNLMRMEGENSSNKIFVATKLQTSVLYGTSTWLDKIFSFDGA